MPIKYLFAKFILFLSIKGTPDGKLVTSFMSYPCASIIGLRIGNDKMHDVLPCKLDLLL